MKLVTVNAKANMSQDNSVKNVLLDITIFLLVNVSIIRNGLSFMYVRV